MGQVWKLEVETELSVFQGIFKKHANLWEGKNLGSF
jgi:hypothetical protein